MMAIAEEGCWGPIYHFAFSVFVIYNVEREGVDKAYCCTGFLWKYQDTLHVIG